MLARGPYLKLAFGGRPFNSFLFTLLTLFGWSFEALRDSVPRGYRIEPSGIKQLIIRMLK
jgi:hypothetical protein